MSRVIKTNVEVLNKIIFNEEKKTTVLVFRCNNKDTSYVSKAIDTDKYDPYIGYALAAMYHLFGSRSAYNKFIHKLFCTKENTYRIEDYALIYMYVNYGNKRCYESYIDRLIASANEDKKITYVKKLEESVDKIVEEEKVSKKSQTKKCDKKCD